MKFVDIESRFGDITLRITPVRHPWDADATTPAWDFQLTGPELDASGAYVEDPDAPQTLTQFFRELDDNHQGFDGDKHWRSDGGAMTIRADHDQINATRLYVTLVGGVSPQWTVQAELHVDPRRFDRVTLNLELFGNELLTEDSDDNLEPIRIDPRQRAREGVRKIGSMAIRQSDQN